jgi:hypothetical protein
MHFHRFVIIDLLSAFTRKRVVWLILVLLPIVIGVSTYIAFLQACTHIDVKSSYGSMTFDGLNDEYLLVVIDGDPDKCELYVDLPVHGPIALGAITEEVLNKEPDIKKADRYIGDETVHHYEGTRGAWFRFEDGKLVNAQLYYNEFPFSNRKDGEYLTFPVDCDFVRDVFGEPDHAVRTRETKELRFH